MWVLRPHRSQILPPNGGLSFILELPPLHRDRFPSLFYIFSSTPDNCSFDFRCSNRRHRGKEGLLEVSKSSHPRNSRFEKLPD